jgi:hypothetical protein
MNFMIQILKEKCKNPGLVLEISINKYYNHEKLRAD